LKSFEEVWPIVAPHTLLNHHKARSLYSLLAGSPSGYDVAECGVFRGGMTLMMALQLEDTNRRVHAFDSFEGLPAARTDEETFYYLPGAMAADPGDVALLFEPHRKNIELHPGRFSETLPGLKTDLGFVHVDCDVYSSARDCMECLYDNLVPDGVMVFDDFRDLGGGVAQALREHVERTGEIVYAGPIEQAFIFKGRTRQNTKEAIAPIIYDAQNKIYISAAFIMSNESYLDDLASGAAVPDLPGGSLDRAEQYANKIHEVVAWHRQILDQRT